MIVNFSDSTAWMIVYCSDSTAWLIVYCSQLVFAIVSRIGAVCVYCTSVPRLVYESQYTVSCSLMLSVYRDASCRCFSQTICHTLLSTSCVFRCGIHMRIDLRTSINYKLLQKKCGKKIRIKTSQTLVESLMNKLKAVSVNKGRATKWKIHLLSLSIFFLNVQIFFSLLVL